MNDIPLTLFSGGAIAGLTLLVSYFVWLGQRAVSHQTQIKHLDEKIDHVEKNLETKIDHVDQKIELLQANMDRMFTNLKEYMDVRFKHLEDKIDTFEVRLSRVEGYLFDVRLKDQIQHHPIYHENKE
ncbi:MAG: hypothetical protein ACH349_06155 [Candidatus Rhabdochlamydia sp.]